MAQSLFTTQEPGAQDLSDGTVLMLGTYITPAVDGVVTGLRYRFPETGQGPVLGALFRTSDGVKIGADVAFSLPVLDDWNEVALAAPVLVSAGEEVCPAFRLVRYTASFGGGVLPITNGDLSAPGDGGRFSSADPDGTVQFPTGSAGSCYFADLVFEAAAPASGTVATTLGLAPAAVGERISAGPAALVFNLALAGAGARASAASAATALGLAPAAVGERISAGAAALGFNLALNARGPAGLCNPVPAFSGACVSVPTSPGACVPAPSFLEAPS